AQCIFLRFLNLHIVDNRERKKMHWALFALSKTPRSGSEETLDQKAPFHPKKNLKDQCKRYQKFV
ncbi:MAG: hypothetical protein AAFN09_17570, partial [Pseudomonadota bacterium]